MTRQLIDMTDADFDSILLEVIREETAESLLTIPGVYECLREHFNNEVIRRWENE